MSKYVSNNAREFLLSFFEDEAEGIKENHFERDKTVGNFVLVKYFDGNRQEFGVQVFTVESRRKALQAREDYKSSKLFYII